MADSTSAAMTHDSSNNKMNDMGMQGGDMMGSMQPMMQKMSSMQMSDDFDRDFAGMMIEHHQGAIDMSKIELAKGTDEKMKTMAQQIITAQTEEIKMFRGILANFKPSGMVHGKGELQKLSAEMGTTMGAMQMTGNTDKDFAMMMIAHHESAVKMFKAEQNYGMNSQLKQMAEKGINGQSKEITEFKTWLGMK